MAKKQNPKQSKNNDAAALGNEDVSSEVEVGSGEITQDNNNNLHNDPDFYIGQEPDETK